MKQSQLNVKNRLEIDRQSEQGWKNNRRMAEDHGNEKAQEDSV